MWFGTVNTVKPRLGKSLAQWGTDGFANAAPNLGQSRFFFFVIQRLITGHQSTENKKLSA